MNIERLKQLVRAYGAASDLWPAEERSEARAFLATSAEATRVVEQELRLDAVLSRSQVAQPSAALLDRIVATATAHPQSSPLPKQATRRWFSIDLGFGRIWQQAAGLAACAVLGFVVGWTGIIDVPTSSAGEYEFAVMVTDDLPFDGVRW